MLLRLLGYTVFVAATAFAGWPRYLSGGWNGESFDSPPPHSLKYFLTDPCLRPKDDGFAFALACTVNSTPTTEERKRWASTRTDLLEVGQIAGFTIYDLWYRRDGYSYPYFDVRSVLVKTSASEYRELNVQARNGDDFPASEIVILDGEPILVAKAHPGGNHNWETQMLYMFGPGGPVTPDFTAVHDAVAKLMPPNMHRIWVEDELASKTYSEEIWNNFNQEPRVPEDGGKIVVTYRFANGRAIVTSSKFERPTIP
jgi:hypothetical protein